jgi:hypothetical protein
MAEAPVCVCDYLRQMIWPTRLAAIYTHPEDSLRWWPVALALMAALSVATYLLRRKHPYLWMGWLLNLGMLVPVSGIVQISRHAQADHYNYLPQIGLYVGLTWVAVDWAGKYRKSPSGVGGAARWWFYALCRIPPINRLPYWRDSIALLDSHP